MLDINKYYKDYFIPKEKRKRILFITEDVTTISGIATISREKIFSTCHHFNYTIIASSSPNNPLFNKSADLSQDTNNEVKRSGVDFNVDADVKMFVTDSFDNIPIIRQALEHQHFDAIMFITDPRFYLKFFMSSNEFRKQLPLIYINIWDSLPIPIWNYNYYNSCDALFAISKQTKNINELLLQEKAKDKIIKYVPHGINLKTYYPVDKNNKELVAFKKILFKDKEYKYIMFFNSRNMWRKEPATLILAYRYFLNGLESKNIDTSNILLLLNTEVVLNEGTDLESVRKSILGHKYYNNLLFLKELANKILSQQELNLVYNMCDVTVLPSSSEGFGLSIAESIATATPVIGNVTGGIQDQMRFEDENGKWIEFNLDFLTNNKGNIKKKCGEWAFPVFPNNSTLKGSPMTPYLFEDRLDYKDLANVMIDVFSLSNEERERRGKVGLEWLSGEESKMSNLEMGKSLIEGINETINKFKPLERKIDLIKINSELADEYISQDDICNILN